MALVAAALQLLDVDGTRLRDAIIVGHLWRKNT